MSKSGNKVESRRRQVPALLFVVVFVTIAIGGGWLLYSKYLTEAEQIAANLAKDHPQASSPAAVPAAFRKLVGRWLRPDGGYVIEIRHVGAEGNLQAAYFNPRPINVSQARVIQKNNQTQIFIELRDVGYPGATYALTYHGEQDVLAGVYYQPAAGQSFEVAFVRMK
jgi:hypothetical protein